MDKTKHFDYNECKYSKVMPFPSETLFFILALNSTIHNSPMHTNSSTMNEEDELEREIEHLERRLASAKSQLLYVTYQKNKQLKS